MAAIAKIALGAPNIYRVPDEMRRTLGGVRMDVCAFVGVAPRGPVRLPDVPEHVDDCVVRVGPEWQTRRSVAVAVESWDEYLSLYGGFDGPGRLPYAVASFFEQGGRKAYIVRIVHDYGDTPADKVQSLFGVAHGELVNVTSSQGSVALFARNEGAWGNHLRAALGFSVKPIQVLPDSTRSHLQLDLSDPLLPGSLLRLSVPVAGEDRSTYELRFVSRVSNDGLDADGNRVHEVTLDAPLSEIANYVELVEGDIIIDDGAGTVEQFNGVGLSSLHPRWLAWVLYDESALVYPAENWSEGDILPRTPYMVPVSPRQLLSDAPVLFSSGEDRYDGIVHEDFFDRKWVLGNDTPGAAIHALTLIKELSAVVVPDLYVPESLPEQEEVEVIGSLAGATFSVCRPIEDSAEENDPTNDDVALPGLMLDPGLPGELADIIALQKRVVELADVLNYFIVLLDVPPGLSHKQMLQWRSHFHSSYCAAYAPWLAVSRSEDKRDRQILLNPSAVAAGIIAQRELSHGVPHGPANVIAKNIVQVAERISPQRHDELHPLGINIFVQQRDGALLSAARTLSRDKRYRQLSVRRLMLMLHRALEQQMQWMVFEPNTPALWTDVRHMLTNYLRQLYSAGAFKGASEEEAFFVRCDEGLNHRRVVDAGQVIVEIGVAPAEPLEFIAVRITRGGDGTLTAEG